jgi:hypothetical protein
MNAMSRPLGEVFSTLQDALQTSMNIDFLKKLAALTGQTLPARKPELVLLIFRHLDFNGLRAEWENLDLLQKAAVAEVVHARSTRLDLIRFQAKYGKTPDFGNQDKYGKTINPSRLCFFFYGHQTMPNDIKSRLKAWVPPPVMDTIKPLDILPSTVERPYDASVSRPGMGVFRGKLDVADLRACNEIT